MGLIIGKLESNLTDVGSKIEDSRSNWKNHLVFSTISNVRTWLLRFIASVKNHDDSDDLFGIETAVEIPINTEATDVLNDDAWLRSLIQIEIVEVEVQIPHNRISRRDEMQWLSALGSINIEDIVPPNREVNRESAEPEIVFTPESVKILVELTLALYRDDFDGGQSMSQLLQIAEKNDGLILVISNLITNGSVDYRINQDIIPYVLLNIQNLSKKDVILLRDYFCTNLFNSNKGSADSLSSLVENSGDSPSDVSNNIADSNDAAKTNQGVVTISCDSINNTASPGDKTKIIQDGVFPSLRNNSHDLIFSNQQINTCIVLGCLAEKLAGHLSGILFTQDVQKFLLQKLAEVDNENPLIILHAIIALEKFAHTRENKTKLMEIVFMTDAENPLKRFETWRNSKDQLKIQVGFVSEWLLDNHFVVPSRVFSCEYVEDCKNYVILNVPDDLSDYSKISPNGLEARCDSKSFQTFWSTACVSQNGMDTGLWYYEVEIITDGIMQIGWASKSCQFQDQNGVGDDYRSVGYDGSRRCLWYGGQKETLPDSPYWKPGDIIGTVLDFNKCIIEFYLNGFLMVSHKQIFDNCQSRLFAAVSLNVFQQCRFNFGNLPFRLNMQLHPTFHRWQNFNDYAAMFRNVPRIVLPRYVRLEHLTASEVDNMDENMCIICFVNTANIKLLPCQHSQFCLSCVENLLSENCPCPLCRSTINDKVALVVD